MREKFQVLRFFLKKQVSGDKVKCLGVWEQVKGKIENRIVCLQKTTTMAARNEASPEVEVEEEFEDEAVPPHVIQEEMLRAREVRVAYAKVESLNALVPLGWYNSLPPLHLDMVVKDAIQRYWSGQTSPICTTMSGISTQLRIKTSGVFYFQVINPEPTRDFHLPG